MDENRGIVARQLLRAGLLVQAAGTLVNLWLQPGGFAFGSRSFVEHEVLAPLWVGVSILGFLATWIRPPIAILSAGILSGSWIVVGLVPLVGGSTSYARVMALPVALGIVQFILARMAHPGPLGIGGLLGGLLGAIFWVCAVAPPPSTRPAGGDLGMLPAVEGPLLLESTAATVKVHGARVSIAAGHRTAWLDLAPGLNAVADSGLWSLFDFRSVQAPAWAVRRMEGNLLELRSECPDFTSRVLVSLEGKTARFRILTTYPRDIAAHLASAVVLELPGSASLSGVHWRTPSMEPTEFAAFRRGRLEFMRSSSEEKGPFETLAIPATEDPILEIDGWSMQVRGWAVQASRGESPTAGWGISQGAIERWGHMYFWELAATSVGRGWHTVRIAKGTYLFEVVLTVP